MKTEDAYKFIAEEGLESIGALLWESIAIETIVYNRSTRSIYWAVTGDERVRTSVAPSDAASSRAFEAALFLRDDLLKTTGHLCYGFTFTLFKDGQFDIQYRYDNPYKDIEEQMAAE
ncbi:MAG: hypothetical protein U1F46_08615 [Marinagarivorans sp.]